MKSFISAGISLLISFFYLMMTIATWFSKDSQPHPGEWRYALLFFTLPGLLILSGLVLQWNKKSFAKWLLRLGLFLALLFPAIQMKNYWGNMQALVPLAVPVLFILFALFASFVED